MQEIPAPPLPYAGDVGQFIPRPGREEEASGAQRFTASWAQVEPGFDANDRILDQLDPVFGDLSFSDGQQIILERPRWRGPAVFFQQGWLRTHIEARQQRRSREREDYGRAERRGLAELKTATVRVRARSPGEAAEVARDAIAVARLFQRIVLPGWSLDDQTFGLTDDVGSPVKRYWSISTGSKARGHGWRFGIGASWTFTPDMLRRIDEDARF